MKVEFRGRELKVWETVVIYADLSINWRERAAFNKLTNTGSISYPPVAEKSCKKLRIKK